MKVKELNNKLAHVCWSPHKVYPSYIACGTAAEQLDSSFRFSIVFQKVEKVFLFFF
jgi:hypothetical protein